MKLRHLLGPGALGVVLAGLTIGVLADGSPTPDLTTMTRSLSLRDALAIAWTSNVSIKQAQADADAASATARSAQAQQRPNASITTYATVGDSSNILTTSPGVVPQNLFAVPPRGFADQNLMVMVPILTGGTLAGRSTSARSLAAAAQAGVAGTRLSVSAEVTRAYAGVALGDALAAVAQAQQAAEDEQVRVTGEKVQNGRLAPVDLLREQAAQAEARQAVIAALNNQAKALVTFRAALGLSQSARIALTDNLDALSAAPADVPGSLAAALAEARSRRPELAAADSQVKAARAGVRGAAGAYAPQIYGVAMGDASAERDLARTGFTVGLTARLPLYDGGRRRAEVDAAKARADRAQADTLQREQQVEQETATAWLNWQTATAQVRAVSVGVTAAQQGYDLANLRYNAGKSTTAERLDALAALVRSEATAAQAKADLITARAQLLAAVGRV